ncbi:hypothetical protein [Croceitalea rosinachiae]|uniref:Uncharacterized protein n=1 Tax=Croceitalea rosinachiae TaxID=3075596 RepID=A0ABU3A7T7_9FLAO|nr:hypothetical protein [Croceitalea sp. F388]MDT0605885.1 hypothetical protein [Croceitalea sp. F388]
MAVFELWLTKLNRLFLSKQSKNTIERIILILAITSFIVHLIFIYAANLFPFLNPESSLLSSPVAAVYTPFSFILIYEVYLLVYYLPRSITTYISKQYEIISLIIIRRLFKDLANLKLSNEWFSIKGDLQFTYDILASIILFYLLFWFYRLNKSRKQLNVETPSQDINLDRFINFKKTIAVILVPILLGLVVYSFGIWSYFEFTEIDISLKELKNINNIFFDEFFSMLIIVDVLLLLVSFFYTDKYHKVIRNSGFIISTILIRLSFSIDGLVNTVLIVFAVLFGLIILAVHNSYERHLEKPTSIN